MGVMCQILLSETREGVHRAGQPVKGTLRYAVDEPTEYEDIVVSLIGKGRCSWSESRSGDESDDSYSGNEMFVSHHINVLKKTPGQTVTIPIGMYDYPFEFFLPANIPPTFKDSYCKITYKIKAKFVKAAFFSINKDFSTELNVYSNVNAIAPEPVIYGLEKTLFKLLAKKKNVVNLKAEVAKSLVSPGEKVRIAYVVTNDTDVVIPTVQTQLTCEMTYTADCGRKKTNKKTIKECIVQTPSVLQNSIGNLLAEVPTLPEMYSIQHAKIVSRVYKLMVFLTLPMPHLDAGIEIPIVIGERAGAVLELEALESDEPPSYQEAMAEDQEKTDLKKI